ncbi:MAG: Asp/Glu/hydantoin racemase [Planococcus sp. (in: Bacteria)]|nr:Asp/Glu/hydantoin racemase [Planococcus sp. (in: firmicutes)]
MTHARIGVIHATPNAISPMKDVLKKYSSYIQSLHFLDEGIIEGVNQSGAVTAPLLKRLLGLIEKADEGKVDGVVFSCSSFTPYIEKMEPYFDFPIVSVYYAMLEKAVDSGKRVGIVATLAAVGRTFTDIIEKFAEKKQKELTIFTETIIEATEALIEGNLLVYDELIRQKINALSKKCDVIVIAQLSMIRALENFQVYIPLLTGSETSIKSLIGKLNLTPQRIEMGEIHE